MKRLAKAYTMLRYRGGAHSANFDEKVHKPQSKYYKHANMQLIFAHILWMWILLPVHHNFLGSEGLQGTDIEAFTEDRSVNAVPQILYGQYLILGAFGSYMI